MSPSRSGRGRHRDRKSGKSRHLDGYGDRNRKLRRHRPRGNDPDHFSGDDGSLDHGRRR